MKLIICTALFTITNVLAYHDPDLNYHVNQLQKLQNCEHNGGYSYPTPAIQLTSAGVQAAAAPRIIPHAILPAQATYSPGIPYQAQPQPSVYAKTSPPVFYPNYEQNNIAAAQREEHGYATSAGLSAYSTSGTVRPQATYAQAPIIAKITAAPLIARFSTAPAKTTYVTQNSVSQSGYTAGSRASLNSYSAVHTGGPVVAQVYAAPSVRYETSPALRQPQAQLIAQRYVASTAQLAPASNFVTQSVISHAAPVHYSQYAAAGNQQYAAQSAVQYAPATATYVNQFAAPNVAKYASAAVQQYSAPAIQYSTQHAAPVAQYATQHVASIAQYAAQQYSPAAAQHTAKSAIPVVQQLAAGHIKNAHTEFLENYDAHPKYSYEYGVNDPHTGDIKHQKEERDGEVVKGQYSLVEPDGSVRTVEYVADWETGFHANVRNSKDNQH